MCAGGRLFIQLYLAQKQFEQAETAIDRALQPMGVSDEDALLAEALTRKGVMYCRSNPHVEAKRALEDAHRLAARCGDNEGRRKGAIDPN